MRNKKWSYLTLNLINIKFLWKIFIILSILSIFTIKILTLGSKCWCLGWYLPLLSEIVLHLLWCSGFSYNTTGAKLCVRPVPYWARSDHSPVTDINKELISVVLPESWGPRTKTFKGSIRRFKYCFLKFSWLYYDWVILFWKRFINIYLHQSKNLLFWSPIYLSNFKHLCRTFLSKIFPNFNFPKLFFSQFDLTQKLFFTSNLFFSFINYIPRMKCNFFENSKKIPRSQAVFFTKFCIMCTLILCRP